MHSPIFVHLSTNSGKRLICSCVSSFIIGSPIKAGVFEKHVPATVVYRVKFDPQDRARHTVGLSVVSQDNLRTVLVTDLGDGVAERLLTLVWRWGGPAFNLRLDVFRNQDSVSVRTMAF